MSDGRDSAESKLAAFKVELAKLLDASCGSLDAALELLQSFMHRGYSAMSRNKEWASKKKDTSTTSFSCNHTGCAFRVLLRRDGAVYRFALGQSHASAHSDHALEKPGRASNYTVTFLQRETKELRSEGRTGLDLLTAVSKRAADIGIDVQATVINNVRRSIEKATMQARVFEGIDTSFLLDLGEKFLDGRTGDIDPAAAAVFGMLSKLQTAYADAYVRVCVDHSNAVNYIFVSMPRQRVRGSLFGSLRLFDDKHGVSSSAYHLALCTVATNTGSEVVGWALLAHSDGASWRKFVQDCVDAFATTMGGPARKWCLSIADGDGQIASAVAAADASVQHWACWFHFKRLVRTKHLRLAAEWEVVHGVIDTLLLCDRESECVALVADARAKIASLTDVALRDMHIAMLDEIVAFRLLPRSTKFTCKWNSQSAAESMNSVMQRIGVGADVSLPLVLDKLIGHMERQERASDAWKRRELATQQAKYIGALQGHVTKKAFKQIALQYDSAVLLVCTKETDASYTVRSKSSGKEPRAVQKRDGSVWVCSCNMAVYMGVPCRHQIAVLLMLEQVLPIEMVDGRWWSSARQPDVTLANASPFRERNVTVAHPAPSTTGTMPAHFSLLTDTGAGEAVAPDAVIADQPPDTPLAARDSSAADVLALASAGNSSDGDMPVYHVDGKPVAIPLKPSEVRNEVLAELRGGINAIGLGPGSIEKLRDLQENFRRWTATAVEQPAVRRGLTLMPSVRTVGAPQKLRLEAGPRKARLNGKRSKAVVTCSKCKQPGHTKTTCRKRAEQDGDAEPDKAFACGECGRLFTSAQARSTHVTLSHNRKRNKTAAADADAAIGIIA